jgi:hypothetical protein
MYVQEKRGQKNPKYTTFESVLDIINFSKFQNFKEELVLELCLIFYDLNIYNMHIKI